MSVGFSCEGKITVFGTATPTFNAQTVTLDGGQRLLGLTRDVAYLEDR